MCQRRAQVNYERCLKGKPIDMRINCSGSAMLEEPKVGVKPETLEGVGSA